MSMRATFRVATASAVAAFASMGGGSLRFAAANEASGPEPPPWPPYQEIVDATNNSLVEDADKQSPFQTSSAEIPNDTTDNKVESYRSTSFAGSDDHDVHILPVRFVPFKLHGDQDLCLAVDHAKLGSDRNVYAWNCSDAFMQLWSYHGVDKTLRPSVNAGWCLVRENDQHSSGTRLYVDDCHKAGKAGEWDHHHHDDHDHEHTYDGACFDLGSDEDLCIGVLGDAHDGAQAVLTPPAEGHCFRASGDSWHRLLQQKQPSLRGSERSK